MAGNKKKEDLMIEGYKREAEEKEEWTHLFKIHFHSFLWSWGGGQDRRSLLLSSASCELWNRFIVCCEQKMKRKEGNRREQLIEEWRRLNTKVVLNIKYKKMCIKHLSSASDAKEINVCNLGDHTFGVIKHNPGKVINSKAWINRWFRLKVINIDSMLIV